MPLNGQRIGVFELQALIGAGGMGEVYRARDTRLGREVAIKILPPAFQNDPDRLARLQREARLLAVAQSSAHRRDLWARGRGRRALRWSSNLSRARPSPIGFERGPVPVAEALTIASQIVDALGYGARARDHPPRPEAGQHQDHARGRREGLDFGLAKTAADERIESGPLAVAGAIADGWPREGLILGTAAYMSPDQARGKPVDKRTDIWAFGCVLYEMLTGQLPFPGNDRSDTVAAILEREVDWDAVPDEHVPEAIRRLLRDSLQKDTKARLRDIGDARRELEAGAESSCSRRRRAPPPRRRTERLAWITAVTVLSLVAVERWRRGLLGHAPARPQWIWRSTHRRSPSPVDLESLAVPPDGQKLAFVANAERASLTCGFGPVDSVESTTDRRELAMRPCRSGPRTAEFRRVLFGRPAQGDCCSPADWCGP